MDTITHTLFGLVIYKSTKKDLLESKLKKPLLFAALAGSQIPDIDVVSKYFDSEGLYQMWHRGLTHSIFMAPIWAVLLFLLSYLIWKVKDKRIFYVSLFAVILHSTSDLFNAWGTGYLEPFSNIRISFGTIPIIDFVIWAFILIGFILSKLKKYETHHIFRIVLLVIMLHVFSQSLQGYLIYQNTKDDFEQQALSASFIPGKFKIIGKNGSLIEILDANVWGEPVLQESLQSQEDADLEYLFSSNPKAKTLYTWSPFVVIVDDDDILGVYDPRFYRNGQSFLFEYISKN